MSMPNEVKRQVGLRPGEKLKFWLTPREFFHNFTELVVCPVAVCTGLSLRKAP